MVDLVADDIFGAQHFRAQDAHFPANPVQPIVHASLLTVRRPA
jgi:hypothetical protein